MPVHFKATSEYDTNYKWLDSFKSRSFSPEPEQMMDPAGKPSVKIYTSVEPPLQHKKRLGGPATSLSTDYFSVPSRKPDFTLLGQQEKFASNVKYQPKPSSSEPKIYKNKENFGDASPPSKQLKMQKRIKPLIKERHPPVKSSSAHLSKSDLVSPPPAPREVKNLDLKEALKDKDLKDVLGEAPSVDKSIKEPTQVSKGEAVSDQLLKEPPAKPKKAEKAAPPAMNEFVQTNMKKGVAMSAPEAPADYALKYQAGVAPARPLWKSSEYQKQFQWKKGVKASPLLAAQEIVHKSNTELGPYKTDGVPRLSEYNRQFQAWKPQIFPADVNLNNNNSNNNNAEVEDIKRREKAKVKRSKSAAALRHSVPVDKFEDEERDEDNVAEELKAKLSQTHGKIRRLGTEYRSNYKSPTRYSYDHGAWKGASAPQMMPRASDIDNKMDQNNNNNNNNNSNNNAAEKEAPPLSNWFAEVIELRRRAAEYRRRAQGTHFSREHLVQLMAQQNQCWDLASVNGSNTEEKFASSNIQALDLHTRPPAGKPSPLLRDPSSEDADHNSLDLSDVDDQVQEEEVEAKESDKAGKGKKKKARGAERKARKMAWLEKDRETIARQARALELKGEKQQADFHGEDEDVEGRLPTPVLKQESPDRARRHHLDLTTPSIGGAILTCPASKGSKLIVTSRSGDSYVTASDDFPTQQQQQHKTYNLNNLLTMPTLGRPSGDTHPLRDEDSASDRPLQTRYVVSPGLPNSDEDKENIERQQQPVRRSKKPSKPSKLSAVQEGFGQTWAHPGLEEVRNKRLAQEADDDAVSVSVMSVASSASLASEVLERTRKQEVRNKRLAQEADDDAVSVSVMSVASSASLASEVLERTRKRQQFWNKDSKAC
ncbi:nuclear protein mdm1 [Plakobranchus ocellatus]|uniref:Nuclear protein MDM1 n=1 Tax=Plakobranchus ocellatus TaxID=259542 RepID=A0AAV4BSD0_9GAST|nr:nuclear protein mdm1 [Plakobranchus ocellatus]